MLKPIKRRGKLEAFSYLLASFLGCRHISYTISYIFLISIVIVSSSSLASASTVTQEVWTKEQVSLLRSLSLIDFPKEFSVPSNRVANNPKAIQFGNVLFFDRRLSSDGAHSCASCHQPDRGFTDGNRVAHGVGAGNRNTPTIIGAAWQRWFLWDGRKDSLWSQALVPFEAINELGVTRTGLVKVVLSDSNYRTSYEAVFGPIPQALLDADLPLRAGLLSGVEAQQVWYRVTPVIRKQVNVFFSNIGKAIAAYEHTLTPGLTRFDFYVAGLVKGEDKSGLVTSDEVAGMRLFLDNKKTRCLQCHNGPMLTNGGFHNIGTGQFEGKQLDFGRAMGIQAVKLDEFNCLGDYSDAQPKECNALRFLPPSSHGPIRGAFKTPTLRGLKKTGPYFHDGRHGSLDDVIDHYREPPKRNGPHELLSVSLSDGEAKQLAIFLLLLTSSE